MYYPTYICYSSSYWSRPVESGTVPFRIRLKIDVYIQDSSALSQISQILPISDSQI